MVLVRVVKHLAGGKRKRLPRYRNPIQYLIADANRSAMPSKTKRTHRKADKSGNIRKQVTNIASYDNVTTSYQYNQITDIAKGQEVYQRQTNKIYCLKYTFKGMINWDTAGTPASILRFIVFNTNTDASAPNVVVTSNIYGRFDFPVIRHVYKDIRITRKGDVDRQPIKFTVHFKGLPVRYNGPAATTDYMGRAVRMQVVADLNSTTDVTNVSETFYWVEK